MRKSFILHIDSLSILEKMPDEVAGKFIKILHQYQKTGEVPEMDFALEMAVEPFLNQFKRDKEKYDKIVERNRINGLKGGRSKTQLYPVVPKKPSGLIGNPKNPNKADNDSDNDSDSDSDSNNKKTTKSIIERKTSFASSLSLVCLEKNVSDFHKKEFFNYWSEHGEKDKKMRFEKEKSFNIALRVERWMKNQKKWESEKPSKKMNLTEKMRIDYGFN